MFIKISNKYLNYSLIYYKFVYKINIFRREIVKYISNKDKFVRS